MDSPGRRRRLPCLLRHPARLDTGTGGMRAQAGKAGCSSSPQARDCSQRRVVDDPTDPPKEGTAGSPTIRTAQHHRHDAEVQKHHRKGVIEQPEQIDRVGSLRQDKRDEQELRDGSLARGRLGALTRGGRYCPTPTGEVVYPSDSNEGDQVDAEEDILREADCIGSREDLAEPCIDVQV